MIKEVKKDWGKEEWFENDTLCLKKLYVNKDWQCSLHYHKRKDEIFYIEKGEFLIEIQNENEEIKKCRLPEGHYVRVIPHMLHRFTGLKNENVIVEFSTHHEDSDSYRAVNSQYVG